MNAVPYSGRFRRGIMVLVTVTAVLLGLVEVPAAHAEESPTPNPGRDRALLVELWQASGPEVKAAAETALLGTDADIAAFVSTGWRRAQELDNRASVTRMGVTGGVTVREATERALKDPSEDAVQVFLDSGWREPWAVDQRIRVNQMLASGGPTLRTAAQRALDSDDVEVLEEFLETGWRTPWETDLRIRINQIMAAGGDQVKAAAQRALDANSADAMTEFIDYGWALASARDQEKATIADLTGSAMASAEAAIRETTAAKEAGARAAAAAAAAKAAAQTATSRVLRRTATPRSHRQRRGGRRRQRRTRRPPPARRLVLPTRPVGQRAWRQVLLRGRQARRHGPATPPPRRTPLRARR